MRCLSYWSSAYFVIIWFSNSKIHGFGSLYHHIDFYGICKCWRSCSHGALPWQPVLYGSSAMRESHWAMESRCESRFLDSVKRIKVHQTSILDAGLANGAWVHHSLRLNLWICLWHQLTSRFSHLYLTQLQVASWAKTQGNHLVSGLLVWSGSNNLIFL